MSSPNCSTSAAPATLIFTLVALTITPQILVAGMPAPLPDDVATILRPREEPVQRMQVISFFLLALFLSALVVMWLWNGLRSEFPNLPKLSYWKAVVVTVAWGILFSIVLVMISGARELMTPGAWQKNGATYELKAESSADYEASQP